MLLARGYSVDLMSITHPRGLPGILNTFSPHLPSRETARNPSGKREIHALLLRPERPLLLQNLRLLILKLLVDLGALGGLIAVRCRL